MPKDAKKNVDRYKVAGGHLNEYEFHQNQGQVKETTTFGTGAGAKEWAKPVEGAEAKKSAKPAAGAGAKKSVKPGKGAGAKKSAKPSKGATPTKRAAKKTSKKK